MKTIKDIWRLILLCTIHSDSSCKGLQYFNMTNILLRVTDLSFIAHCLTYSIHILSKRRIRCRKKEKGNLQNKTCGNISTYLNWDIVAVSNSKGVKLLHSLEAKDFMHHTLVSFGFIERHAGQNISWCFWLNIVVSNS